MSLSGPEVPDQEWRRRRMRPYAWTAVALALSAAMVWVAWSIDHARTEVKRTPKTRQRAVTDLVTPAPLDEEERTGKGAKFGSQESVKLERGAWVQVADAAGNLKQQYTASRIDPLPDKRLQMTDPRAVLYGDGGRIVTMRSDSMAARVPKRALESGKLVGNVVIRIFRPKDGRPIDLKTDAPDVTVESPEASFDAASGEIRCDRQVRIAGEVLTFDGEGLSLTLASDGKTVERLVVDRALAPVRISRAAAEAQTKKRKEAAALSKQAAGAASAPGAAASAPGAAASAPGAAAQAAAASAGAPAAPSINPPAGPKRAGASAIATSPGNGKSSTTVGPRLFLLTLYDDVEIISNEDNRRSVVRGDRVDAYFIMKSGAGVGLAVGDPFAPPREPFPVVTALGNLHQQCVSMAFASGMAFASIPDEDPDAVLVTFKGRLVMAPAPIDTPPLGRADGVRMVVNGRPAVVEDSRSEAVITAQQLTFESQVERMELVGSVDDPASVVTPDFTLGAKHFTLDRSTGAGASDGPGTIVMGGAGSKPIMVSWATSMALKLEPGTGNAEGSFRGASFVGEVDVASPDFSMQTGQLDIEAQPVGKKDVPRRVVASHGVKVKSLGATSGKFAADRVEVMLSPNAAGDAQPRTLVATGGVAAGDDTQTLWSSVLRMTFVDPKPVALAPEKATTSKRKNVAKDAAEKPAGMASDIGEVIAEGPVELLLSDGSRVFANRLEGDGVTRSARLLGPDVLVVRGNLVLDQLANIQLQEQPARMSALGPGRASGFKNPVLATTSGPIGRPKISGVPQMQVTWRESLAYADASVKDPEGGPDRGLLLLEGAVKVRASREPREAEALDAQEVQIEIMPRSKQSGAKVAAEDSGAKKDAADAQAIGTMRAKGEVRLEARQWENGNREGDPRLFRLNAPNIRYNGQDGSAFVDGAGSLLVFDPPPPAPPERADDRKSPFSAHGTTRFTWKRSMTMERRPDNTSRVTLEREVVMDHLGNSTTATGTVTADRMTATVRGVEGAKAKAREDVGMSLGGPAELTKVAADGRVVIRTSDLDIEASEFDLDVPTQIGVATGSDGRLVTLIRRGTTTPARAHAFRWDLVKGTLSVEGARGAIGR